MWWLVPSNPISCAEPMYDNSVFAPHTPDAQKTGFPFLWHGKPYYSLDAYCKNTYGEKVYKIALNTGLSCPNRDGTLDTRGCIFCSSGGSGDFASSLFSPEEFEAGFQAGKQRLSGKHTGSLFIAYFQAYTNTYGPISYLEAIYARALTEPDVLGISIATRPDCLPEEILSLLERLKKQYPDKFIWIELGLQTINAETARFIRRGYPLSCFEKAVQSLNELSIPVIVHLILGLPHETAQDALSAVSYLNALPVWGVKLQLLHILKGTDLAALYNGNPAEFCPLSEKEDYLSLLINCLMQLRPDMVVHRVTGDAPKAYLLAPLWSGDKKGLLNALHRQMKEQHAFQGKQYCSNNADYNSRKDIENQCRNL